jgi:hypothetical protein
MSYIILEMHGGPEYAIIVTDEDANNLVFEKLEEVEREAGDCKDALIVEI